MPNTKRKVRKKKRTIGLEYLHNCNIAKTKRNNNTNDSNSLNPKSLGIYYLDDLRRLHNPFNNSINQNSSKPLIISKMPHQSTNYCSGLSPKEKSYIIGSCQTRSKRYANLKKIASEAIDNNKIFTIFGSCHAVRKALLERGWVEKIPAHHMNLSKIKNATFSSKNEVHGELEKLLLSNLVEKYSPNFIWHAKDDMDTSIDMVKDFNTTVNKLKIDALWTTKQGLCSSMKKNYWFYIEDKAEVICPRTYDCYDFAEVEDFSNDFKITACTSLLKWVLSMVANDRQIFSVHGKISTNIINFALNRCKEYLLRKQHKDIDRTLTFVSTGQWNAFLKKYYRLISRDAIFELDTEKKLPLYLGYANILLQEIHKFRPQLSCEGCLNIWIIKPAHFSRGRGIRMASKLGVITNLLTKANAKYVAQKYIEEPLLIHDTKFDIRQYYLVTSTYPLVLWMYKDCYLKFSSQKYNLKNYHESIHLTNNAVQRKYTNCEDRHPDLPYNNMWDLDSYRNYLKRIGKAEVWDSVIYPGMKKNIVGIMLSCQDSLSISKNRFELYGCDFILDKDYKPWLIEINSCPDLNHTTSVTAKICPAVISDIIKVVIDNTIQPGSKTGMFECIYNQPMSFPRYGSAADLIIKGRPLPADYFYKGPIDINDSFDHNGMENEDDVIETLNKLKQYNIADIMFEPEEDCDKSKCDKGAFLCKLSDTATTITTLQSKETLDSVEIIRPCFDENRSETSKQFLPYQAFYNDSTETELFINKPSMGSSSKVIIPHFNFSKLEDDVEKKIKLIEVSKIINKIEKVVIKSLNLEQKKNISNILKSSLSS